VSPVVVLDTSSMSMATGSSCTWCPRYRCAKTAFRFRRRATPRDRIETGLPHRHTHTGCPGLPAHAWDFIRGI